MYIIYEAIYLVFSLCQTLANAMEKDMTHQWGHITKGYAMFDFGTFTHVHKNIHANILMNDMFCL